MNCYQVFDDLPPIPVDGLRYSSDQDEDFWPLGGDFGAPFAAQPPSIWGADQSPFICSPERFSTDNQDLTVLGLFARENRDDPYLPNQIQQFYRSPHATSYYESVPTQPFPFSPVATYFQRQASPIETVTSSSSGFEDRLGHRKSYPLSDQDSAGSPRPLSPPYEPAGNSYSYYIPLGNNDSSWAIDPFCALPQIQQIPDEDPERSARHLQELDFNLNEINLKEEPYYQPPSSSGAMSRDDPDTTEAQNSPFIQSSRRTSGGGEEEHDSDYKPVQPKARRAQATTNNNQVNGLARSKVTKRVSPKATVPPNGKEKQHLLTTINSMPQKSGSGGPSRPFSCPLAPYGCHTTFTSKNEWKRHITSRHLCLGFWRCDLCVECDTRPNDFNRKDLFTQHLRRMHHPCRDEINNGISQSTKKASAASKKGKPERRDSQSEDASNDPFEAALDGIRERCWVQIRDPPTRAFCAFCENHFAGENSFEDWLEHTGKHLADSAKLRHKNGRDAGETAEKWQKDTVFREWLLEQGFVRPNEEEEGAFVLVESAAVRDINLLEMEKNGKA